MEVKLITAEEVQQILNSINNLISLIEETRDKRESTTKIYTNKTIKELLGIQDKLLKKYRDEGLLGYHQVGDKYWYTQSDIDLFLANTHLEAYAYSA